MRKILFLLIAITSFPSFSQISQRGVLVVGTINDPKSLDPAHETSYVGMQVHSAIFDTLVEYSLESDEIQSGLASEWKISSDGRLYTFVLREGVRFHDGIEMTAADVVFSLSRQFDRNNPYYQYGPWVFWDRLGLDNLVVKVSAPNRSEVKIELSHAHASFLEMLSMDFASIVSLAAVQKYGADFATHPVGTGPFRFVSWKKDSELVLIRNRSYWRDPPRLNRLVFKVLPRGEDKVHALQNKLVDAVEFPSPQEMVRLRSDDAVVVLQEVLGGLSYLSINTGKEALQDPGVRKSLAYALDREQLLLSAAGGGGELAHSILSVLSEGFSESHFEISYDLVIAEALLRSEGYDRESNPLSLTLYTPSHAFAGLPDPSSMAEEIRRSLGEAGVQIEIVTVPNDVYIDTLAIGVHDLALASWIPGSRDPYISFISLFSPDQSLARSFSFWNQAEFFQKLHTSEEAEEKEIRWAQHSIIQSLIHENLPIIPLFHPAATIAVRNEVQNIIITPEGWQHFHKVWIEQ